MELKEFISKSLIQIYSGVKEAQENKKEINGEIVPNVYQLHKGNNSILGITNNREPIISVEFDVAVTITDATKSKSGMGIFIASLGAGLQSGSEYSSYQQNRLKFSVPVVLPNVQKKDEK